MQKSINAGTLNAFRKALPPIAYGLAVIVLAAFVVFADRFTKQIALTKLNPSQTTDLLPNVVGMTLHRNYGAVANIPIPLLLITGITVIVIAILVRATWKNILQGRNVRAAAYACIIGGAVSNLFDRLSYGYVIDWILLVNRSVINLADIAITVGILIYLLSLKIPQTDTSRTPDYRLPTTD